MCRFSREFSRYVVILIVTLSEFVPSHTSAEEWMKARMPRFDFDTVTENKDVETFSIPTQDYQISAKAVRYFRVLKECDVEVKLESGDVVVVSSAFEPMTYKCVQKFVPASAENNITLEIECHSIYFRFSCEHESLTVKTDDTLFEACGDTSLKKVTGSYLVLSFTRSIFGCHGGYTCSIVATGLEKKSALKTIEDVCGIQELETTSENLDIRTVFQKTRIIGGTNADLYQYPWMALLRIYLTSTSSNLCGGSLVTKTIVVTAAHCLESRPQFIKIGLGIRNAYRNGPLSQWFQSTTFFIHPEYDTAKIVNDIAVILLPEKVSFNRAIKPICFPSLDMDIDLSSGELTVAGWGRTDYTATTTSSDLQTVELIHWSNEKCTQAWIEHLGISEIRENQICALGKMDLNGKVTDACSGDSGGPLAIPINGKWTLVGITSYGYGCATPGIPGVYTAVKYFKEWVLSRPTD